MSKDSPSHSIPTFRDELDLLCSKGLFRTLSKVEALKGPNVLLNGRWLIDFCSNDYLGLSTHPEPKKWALSALSQHGTGSRASRLMSGDLSIHHELEKAVANHLSTQAALVFGSGYLANTGVISALLTRRDIVFMDRACHASMVDGAVLSRAKLYRFRHNDPEDLERLLSRHRQEGKRALVAVEGVYSMDGDLCPISDIIQLKKRYDALLLVDDAHGVGVFGQRGQGTVGDKWIKKTDLLIGTFGKALGGYGAFCAATKDAITFLVNKARPFIFSTALPPCVIASNLAAIRLLPSLDHKRRHLEKLSKRLRSGLIERLGLKSTSCSQIVPVVIGDNRKAIKVAEYLVEEGFWVRAIRPPTVPKNTARLSIFLTALHTTEMIDRLLDILEKAMKS